MVVLRVERAGKPPVTIGGREAFAVQVIGGRSPRFSMDRTACTVLGIDVDLGSKDAHDLKYWSLGELQVDQELTITLVEAEEFDPPTSMTVPEMVSDGVSEETKRWIREKAAKWGWKLKEGQ